MANSTTSLVTEIIVAPSSLPSSITNSNLITAAPPAYTTLLITTDKVFTTLNILSTRTVVESVTVTDAALYGSLSAAAAAASSSSASLSSLRAASSSSAAANPTASSPSSSSSTSNLATVIPEIVIPVLFVLVALTLGWIFLLRRRDRRSAAAAKEARKRKRSGRDDKADPEPDPAAELPTTSGRVEMRASAVGMPFRWSRRFMPGMKRTSGNVHELDGDGPVVAELEAGTLCAGKGARV